MGFETPNPATLPRGVARIFQKGGGGHTVSNIIFMAFSLRNIVGCLLKKRLTKEWVTGTPGPPLSLRPCPPLLSLISETNGETEFLHLTEDCTKIEHLDLASVKCRKSTLESELTHAQPEFIRPGLSWRRFNLVTRIVFLTLVSEGKLVPN